MKNNNIPFTQKEIDLLKVAISYYYIVCVDDNLQNSAEDCKKLYNKLYGIKVR